MQPNKLSVTSDWAKFYVNRLNPRYEFHIRTKYQYMINRIAREMPKYGSIIEMGCGIGSITKQLLRYPHHPSQNFTCTDINEEMLALTIRNLDMSGNINVVQHDIREQYVFPLGANKLHHSHGVLEHFSDSDIRKIIEAQKKSASLIFHYVPSDKYTSKSFGDERLMSPKQWRDICSPDRIEVFNDGYDLLLVWRRK